MRKYVMILLLAIVAACGVRGDPTTPGSDTDAGSAEIG